MIRCGRRRPIRAIVCAMTAAAIGAVTHGAAAFELKHTSHGVALRWNAARVSYVIDPSVEERVRGGAAAAASAVDGWSREGDGPTLATTVGSGEAKPGLDGQNSVILAPHGFAPAGEALAVTVTSYDDASGAIVDSDIVINGVHAFAVLDASAHPASDASPIATDGSSSDDDSTRSSPFDLGHVVSHEVGHTLGLADETDDHASLMYAFTMPGDASIRTPSNDDIDGVDALYATAGSAPSSRGGCGQSSVAGSRTRPMDAWFALALFGGFGVRLATQRRTRAAVRMGIAIGGAVTALVAWPDAARSATPAPALLADAIARVTSVSTSNGAGLFETKLELTPTACRHDPCAAKARAHVWGGTLGGITQRVGGGDGIPRVGDIVDIAFVGGGPAESQAAASAAAVVVVRH